MVKRILFVDHADGLGGAERSLLLFMTHLDSQRYKPYLASVKGKLLATAQPLGISVYPILLPRLRRSPCFPLDWLAGTRAIAAAAHEICADVLYANTVRATLYTAPAARLAKRPFIWHMRDFWLSESKPDNIWTDTFLKKVLCRTATRVITNSRAVADHLPCSNKIAVVHNGIDVSRYDLDQEREGFKQQYQIPHGASIIGMVGRLRPWKGQARFLEMAAEIIQQCADAYFCIVGGSPFGVEDKYPQQLRQLTADLNLRKRVIFTGHLNDVRSALAAMDIFVHPGEPEPFGLVNIEAMAMGKPVVALAHGALPEIVVPGETGLLVLPGDDNGLARAVLSLLENPEQRERMGRAGHERVLKHFTIQKTTAEIEAILHQVSQ